MEKLAVVKTKSALKKPLLLVAGVVILLLVIGTWLWLPRPGLLHTPSATFQLEIADTPEARTQGLSGRSHLPASTALLFVFDEPEPACFWMKDMQFAIDIIWLDAEKQVTKIARNVSPDSYPQVFCPSEPARYVVEVNAGKAQEAGIALGTQLRF